MNNYITLFLGTLTHIGIITKDEAEKLDKKLQSETIPSDFESAYQMLKRVFEEAEVEGKKFTTK
jgi:hypothetical protein